VFLPGFLAGHLNLIVGFSYSRLASLSPRSCDQTFPLFFSSYMKDFLYEICCCCCLLAVWVYGYSHLFLSAESGFCFFASVFLCFRPSFLVFFFFFFFYLFFFFIFYCPPKRLNPLLQFLRSAFTRRFSLFIPAARISPLLSAPLLVRILYVFPPLRQRCPSSPQTAKRRRFFFIGWIFRIAHLGPPP